MAGVEARNLPTMTAAEFLDWDGGEHVGKLELVNGEVRAMSPATPTHGLIQANLAGLIWQHIRAANLPCRVGTEMPVIPQIHAHHNVRVPDLAVTCIQGPMGKALSEPILIIEVLSPSNKKATWESIYANATIPALTEIAVVDSVRIGVEVFHRTPDGNWPKSGRVFEAGDEVDLNSIGATLPIAEIYAGTHIS